MGEIKASLSDRVKYKFVKLVLDNQQAIDMGLDISRSIHNFALSKSPLSFIEGGVRTILSFSSCLNSYSHQFFNTTNGWIKLICAKEHRPLYSIFEPIVKNYQFKHLVFRYDNKPDIGIYYTPVGEIGFDKHGFWSTQTNKYSREEILDFFVKEKVKSLNSKFFSITAEKSPDSDNYFPTYNFNLKDEEIKAIKSETADFYLQYFKTFLDKDIRRSFLFTGPPGVGKSTLSQTIISDLGFTTLKFKYDPKQTNLAVIQFLVKSLKIDAIILDDFDQLAENTQLLEFLVWIHDNCKLVIIITNTLKGFHPGIVRPGRVDKILTVNHLDESVVRSLFGETHPQLVEVTKTWPIAFVNELFYRIKADPGMDMVLDLEELDQRVKAQTNSLK